MVTREELFEAVWTEPMITLSSRYGVSGSYLARVCDSLNVATICDSVNFDVRMEPPGWEKMPESSSYEMSVSWGSLRRGGVSRTEREHRSIHPNRQAAAATMSQSARPQSCSISHGPPPPRTPTVCHSRLLRRPHGRQRAQFFTQCRQAVRGREQLAPLRRGAGVSPVRSRQRRATRPGACGRLCA